MRLLHRAHRRQGPVSCQTSLERVAGRLVTTLEGFGDDERDRFADAFAATGALQCGFCTPGILVRTKALLDKYPEARSPGTRRPATSAPTCAGAPAT